MNLIVDKIASVTKNIPLTSKVEISKKIKAEEGAVLAVEILNNKKIYNQMELRSGRLAVLHKGDRVVVALGSRRALKGFVGDVPKKVKVGDIINILNLGGVSGICTSENFHEVGHALKVKVIGALIDKNGKQLNIKDYTLFKPAGKIENKIPLIILSATCMEVGKTSTACEIIKIAARMGYKVCSAKVSGVAAMRDTLKMKDYGAKKAVTLMDAGFPSTAGSQTNALRLAKGAINFLGKENPDFIVIELGDGILGEYGVMHILKDKEFQKHVAAHVGCAYDPAGALKLAEVCKQAGTPVNVISGPVTDNEVGIKFVEEKVKTMAFNSLTQGHLLFPYLLKNFLKKYKRK